LGALVGTASWISGDTDSTIWGLLWTLGGAGAGILRGWTPGYRFSQWVSLNFGWHRVLPALGLAIGTIAGGSLGLLFWWAVFPIFAGLYLGGKAGYLVGRKAWQEGSRFGFERILALTGALVAAFTGALIARWAGVSFGEQFAGQMAGWITAQTASLAAAWIAVGAVCGAFGGSISGMFADLFGRLSGLVD